MEKDKEIAITYRDKLPHWHQNEKIQFITFRLADSLPQTKVEELKQIIEKFKMRHALPWDDATKLDYYRTISPKYEKLLDNGYGSCILKNKTIQQVVENAIMFYHNDKYDVLAFIVMPNHIHILLKLNGENTPGPIIQSIKRHSAKLINQLLNRNGTVWMKRYFDRIVRSEDNLMYYIHYIINNPRHLHKGEYRLYINNKYFSIGD